MRLLSRSACAPAALLGSCILALLGCGGVREDRTITFSAHGDQVGFQHGSDGIFVADKEGGGLTRIFTPEKDVIAVGTPLWAPKDRRLIFTTARAADGAGAPNILPGTEEDPAGRVFLQQPAVYTCWLRDEPKDGVAPSPRALFTAPVDHAGYVAAGLAVRWHPRGDRVTYVKQVGGSCHAVFEFDLASWESRRVFPASDTARAVVFDWSPDGTHLACVLAEAGTPADGGLWIGRGADWWHVPESRTTGPQRSPPTLEALRAARPAWTKDGKRFAFAATSGAGPNDPARHSLWLGTVDDRRVRLLLEGRGPMHDLVWHPDGERLGLLSDAEGGSLQVSDVWGHPLTVAARPVRTFAGWDAKGRHLAYTTADDVPLKDEHGYSLLLFPDPLARDVLWLAPGDGADPGRAVVSGLRATFARWSPTDEKLSLWFTFCPTHGSIFSRGLGWGLRPGDPAAVVDATTGKISWMAVSAAEKAQVGHYHMLRHDYAAALDWYEQAGRERAARPEPEERRSEWGVVQPRPFRDVAFFESCCLDKLGRHEEAKSRLAEFRAKARRLLPSAEELGTFPLRMGNDPARFDRWLRDEVRSLVPMARDFYCAEVFLSLDAAADGEAFFRKALAEATNDDDRLSAAVLLAQLLLLEDRINEYATVVIENLGPLVRKRLEAAAGEPFNPPVPVTLAGLTILPLSVDDLLARVSDARVEKWVAFCKAFREKVAHEELKLLTDVMLERAYARLGRPKEGAEARERQRANPKFKQGLWEDANAPKWGDGLRSDAKLRLMAEQYGLMTLLTVRATNAFSEPVGRRP